MTVKLAVCGGVAMKKKWKGVLFLLGITMCFFLPAMKVQAEEEMPVNDFEYIDKWLSSYDMSSVNEGMEELFPGINIDADGFLKMILKGKATEAFQVFFRQIKSALTEELSGVRHILVYILVLGIASALFAEFSDLFSGQQIAQAGFYFLYLFLMVVMTKVFVFVAGVAHTCIENIVLFIKLFIPTYFIAVGAAQGAGAAVYYYQLMLVIAYLVESFLNTVLLPFIYSYVLIALLNGLWAEEKLSLLLEFIEKGIGFALKASMGAVTGLSLVQAVIVPAASRLKISAMRKAVSAIPGIGGVAEGVTELMLGSAVLIKNSMGVLLLVILLGVCLVPVLKILIITGTVKLGAAVSGIVSDKRISSCADQVGKGCFLLLRCVFTSAALFIIVVAVVSYTVSA